MSGRQGFRPAQATLKQTLLKYAKEKGFATNFTDFKVRKYKFKLDIIQNRAIKCYTSELEISFTHFFFRLEWSSLAL